MFGTNLKKLSGIACAFVMLGACATSEPLVEASNDTIDTTRSTVTTPQGPIPGSQADLEASAGHRVFFGYNEWALTPQAQDVLARQASWLKQYPEARILVAGNCDERGTREYNLALGKRRSEATKAYLVSLGVDRSRISTVSYGKEKPIDPRANESAWSVNRNATTTVSTVGA